MNKVLIFITLLLLILSLLPILKEVFIPPIEKTNLSPNENSQQPEASFNPNLGSYFDEEIFSEESGGIFLNDPFANICNKTSKDNLPSVSSNTVCLR